METILIVDDEKNYPRILRAVLEDEGFEALTANSSKEALSILNASDVDMVISDLKMPIMDGIALLEKIREKYADIPVLLMTAYGTVEKAVEAIQKGAYNFILKPFENDALILYVNKALEMRRIIRENRRLRSDAASRYKFHNIIGKSRPMREMFAGIEKVAPTDATVLLEGESGTGKELAARSLHYNSSRSDRAFIAVNCAALSESILESELFGHEKGAFTGAIATKKGRFEMADRGTIFLDEIGEVSRGLQVKLLRVLQEKTFERVGGVKPIQVDIRIIAATNKQLRQEMENGNFREDLFYRLNVVHIQLPPLRERREDIPLLAHHFLSKFAARHRPDGKKLSFDKSVDQLLYIYSWPGNVRELENIVERSVILCEGDVITEADLPEDFTKQMIDTLRLSEIPPNAPLVQTLDMVEKEMILRALRLADNVQAHAAKLLQIGKSNLNQKIKKHGVCLPVPTA